MTVHERARQTFDSFEYHRACGMTLEEARPNYARVSLVPGPMTKGGVGGSIHGGVLASLVDVVMLQAIVATLEPADVAAGTADLNLTFLRPALGERIVAEARVIKKGRQLVVTEVDITDAEGRLCARGRTLYALRQS